MKKDHEALMRMDFLIKSAKIYELVNPELSSRLIG